MSKAKVLAQLKDRFGATPPDEWSLDDWAEYIVESSGAALAVEVTAILPLTDLVEQVKQTRRAWLDQYGVPVSVEFAHFAEAIGDLCAAAFAGVPQQFVCKARTANVGASDPQDCDWPVCGCDPYADKVIAAIQESGFSLVKDEDLMQITRTASLESDTAAPKDRGSVPEQAGAQEIPGKAKLRSLEDTEEK